jgi:hypothetical protein
MTTTITFLYIPDLKPIPPQPSSSVYDASLLYEFVKHKATLDYPGAD